MSRWRALLAERDRLRALLRRVVDWTPALPVEACLADEIAAAIQGEPGCSK